MIRPAELTTFASFAFGLRSFLRRRMTPEEARATVRRRLETRAEALLHLVEKSVYGHARSPYLPLLRRAGCELGDVRKLVRDRGVEETLRALKDAGVCVSFEEFKGRTPIARDGLVHRPALTDFDNRWIGPHLMTQSGGSTGRGTPVPFDLRHVAATTPMMLLGCQAHGLLGAPTGVWAGILPDSTGVGAVLRFALMGSMPRRWFIPFTPEELHTPLQYRLATAATVRLARSFGRPIPPPEVVTLDQPEIVARWAAATAESAGRCFVRSSVSMALRVALAAEEEGLDLTGVAFTGGGEAATPAKVGRILRSGAGLFTNYFVSEAGPIAMGCAGSPEGGDLHFADDAFGMIQEPRRVPGADVEVDSFYLTSLLPTAPKVMLNVELDDFGVLETRSCGCALGSLGYTRHIRDVRSFGKLTGEGVTLVGSEMLHVLETVLPGRFGGTALDYQIREEEDGRGFTVLVLVVSPRVALPDDRAVVEAVLAALARGTTSAAIAGAFWDQAGALRIERTEPVWTSRGKLMPLHLGRRT